MRPVVAAGAVYVPNEGIRTLEKAIDSICRDYGFPDEQEFKWSPGRELWMRDNIVEGERSAFFLDVLNVAQAEGAEALVVIVDTAARGAVRPTDPRLDATVMLLERANNLLRGKGRDAFVIADEPGGSTQSGRTFVAECVQTIHRGTRYVQMDRLHLMVATDSKHTRLIQLADLVTGCSVSRVCGESRHSPQIFDAIKPLLRRNMQGQIGGTGLKIHPDLRYVNLYHWVLGDEYHVRGNVGFPYPLRNFAYFAGPDAP